MSQKICEWVSVMLSILLALNAVSYSRYSRRLVTVHHQGAVVSENDLCPLHLFPPSSGGYITDRQVGL